MAVAVSVVAHDPEAGGAPPVAGESLFAWAGRIQPRPRCGMLTLPHSPSSESVVRRPMPQPHQSARRSSEPRCYELRSEVELEQAADELLRQSLADMGRGEYPFYSDSWLRQLAAHEAETPEGTEEGIPDPDYLPAACLRLLAQTPMKREYRSALRLWISGMTVREVAPLLQVSPAQVSRWLRAGLAQLALAAVDLDGLLNRREAIRAAWREDTHRYYPRRERHCKPGQEACRQTGLCTRRYYLRFE